MHGNAGENHPNWKGGISSDKNHNKNYAKNYYLKNKEKRKKTSHEWYIKNKEKANLQSKSYRLKHKEQSRDYLLKHKDEFRETQRKFYSNLRIKVLKKLGDVCVRCSFSDSRALQIDHVNGGGRKEFRECKGRIPFSKRVLLDKVDKYQLLCANCNWIKRNERNEVGFQKPIDNIEI